MDSPALHIRRSEVLGSNSDGGLLFCCLCPVCCGHFYLLHGCSQVITSILSCPPQSSSCGCGTPPPFTSGAISETNAMWGPRGPFPDVLSTHAQRRAAPGGAVQHVLCDGRRRAGRALCLVPSDCSRQAMVAFMSQPALLRVTPFWDRKDFPVPSFLVCIFTCVLLWASPRLGKSSRR